jgi:parallel beta-helix repeat protein
LEEAVARAPSGATVVLRGGVYRTGDLRLNKEIALQPFLDEVPVLDGSRELTNVSQNAGVWTAALEQLPATGDAGQPPVSLWIDDVPLLPAASVAELAAGSFFFDPDAGTVSWVDDPAGKRVEASVFSHAIERVYWELPNVPGPPDEAGLVIRGLTFRRYALTALWLRAAGAQVEHCRFVDGGGQGILAFRGQSVIRFNEFTGQRGAAANLVEFGGGTFSHNWLTGNSWESGGGSDTARVAVFSGGTGGLVRSNLLLDNGGHGLWVGGDPQGHAVLENVVDGCDAPEGSGINLNGGYDTLVAGNVVARCPFGVRVTNTSGSQLYNNTLVNTGNPVQVREYLQDTVVGGPGNSARTTLVNNVFWGATNTEWPWALLTVQSSLCGEHELIAELDHNGYFQTDAGVPTYAIAWDPLPSAGEQNAACADQTQEHFEEVAAFASATGWETHGLSGRTSEAVFEDPAAREPAPRAGGPLHRAGSRLPETVLRSLGWDDRDAPDLGAVQTSR